VSVLLGHLVMVSDESCLTICVQALRAKGQEVKTLEAEIEQLRKRNARKSAMLTKGYLLFFFYYQVLLFIFSQCSDAQLDI
jgi:hypothetical protein